MRYTYLGDMLTDRALIGLQCDPVRRADGKCIINGKLASALVCDAQGKRYVVKRRRLRVNRYGFLLQKRRITTMGLDIYVRWDNITDEEKEAQFTGFSGAPDAGYLRFTWAGVGFMREFSAKNNCPNPITETFQNWDGFNGEGYSITRDKMNQLLAYQSRLEGWLVEHPLPALLDNEQGYYYRKIQNWIKLLDFIHSNADKPGLMVVYG